MSQFKDIMKLSEDGGWLSEDSVDSIKCHLYHHCIEWDKTIEYFRIVSVDNNSSCNWFCADRLAQNCNLLNRKWRLHSRHELYALIQFCKEFDLAFAKVFERYYKWSNHPDKIEFWTMDKAFPETYRVSMKFNINRGIDGDWRLQYFCDNWSGMTENVFHNIIIVRENYVRI